MWPFKNRYKKLKKEEIAQAIYELEKQEQAVEDGVLEHQEEIDFLLAKGKKEKSEDLKLLYAKKINHLKEQIKNNISKGSYLLYNIKLLTKLKEAVEDKAFYLGANKISLDSLLKDQTNLAKFLNKALNTKISAEEVLTSSDEIFTEIQDAYEPNKEIYGVTKSDDELLAVFESGADEDIPEADTMEQIEEIMPLQADQIKEKEEKNGNI